MVHLVLKDLQGETCSLPRADEAGLKTIPMHKFEKTHILDGPTHDDINLASPNMDYTTTEFLGFWYIVQNLEVYAYTLLLHGAFGNTDLHSREPTQHRGPQRAGRGPSPKSPTC